MKQIDEITMSFYIIYKCFTHTHHQTLSPQKIKTDDYQYYITSLSYYTTNNYVHFTSFMYIYCCYYIVRIM